MAKKQVKKEIKKTSGKVEKTKSNETLNFDFKWNKSFTITIIILFVVGLLIAGCFYYKNSSSKFTFHNIPFEKAYYGKILMYTTAIQMNDASGKIIGIYAIDFRNDPRRLNVQSNISSLNFKLSNTTYVVDDNIGPGCEDTGLAFINLARFLSNVGLTVKGAQNNATLLEQNSSIPYINCDRNPGNTVVMISKGDETKIEQYKSCYKITFKDCEVLKATETFELNILERLFKNSNTSTAK